MPSPFSTLEQAFERLVSLENQSISQGIPSLRPANDAADIAYLRYKLRLLTRVIFYRGIVQPDSVNLTPEAFQEVYSLLARRPELWEKDTVLMLFRRLLILMEKGFEAVELSSFRQVVTLYDRYKESFTVEEHQDFLELLSAFAISTYNRGRVSFFVESTRIMIRNIGFGYGNLRKVTNGNFLTGSKFINVAAQSHMLMTAAELHDLGYILGREPTDPLLLPEAWAEHFVERYQKFLEPTDQKQYLNLFKVGLAIKREEYRACIRILLKTKFKQNDIQNLSVKRLLFSSVFSLYYHGTASDRRFLHRKQLRPETILERLRKHIDYLKAERKHLGRQLKEYEKICQGLRLLQQLYQLRAKNTLTQSEQVRYYRWAKEIPTYFGANWLYSLRWLNQQLDLL